jgi:hypothetical protein
LTPSASQTVKSTLDRNSQLITQIKEEHADVLSFENQINKGHWTEKSNSKGIKVSTRR